MAAQCQRVLGNDKEAEELFRRAIQSNPKDIDSYGGIAEIYQENDDDKSREAVNKILDQMVAANPDNWLAYLRRYGFRISGGVNDEARADLAQAVKLAPTELDVLLTAADRATNDKEFDKAREYLDQAKKHHPQAAKVYVAYSQMERYADRLPEAAERWKKAWKSIPTI